MHNFKEQKITSAFHASKEMYITKCGVLFAFHSSFPFSSFLSFPFLSSLFQRSVHNNSIPSTCQALWMTQRSERLYSFPSRNFKSYKVKTEILFLKKKYTCSEQLSPLKFQLLKLFCNFIKTENENCKYMTFP